MREMATQNHPSNPLASPRAPNESYNRARYYDPASGRFVSEDPNVLGATRSMYAYVDNEPSGYLSRPTRP